MRFIATSLFAVFLSTAHAQTASGPVLGWSLSPDTSALQTVYGIPGAGRLGPEISLPADLRIAALNPANAIALVLTGDAGVPALLNLETLEQTPLDRARPQPDLAVWSPSGQALALVYRGAQWVQIFTHQTDGLQLAAEWTTSARTIAVSDDGTALLSLNDAGLSLTTGGNSAVLTASAPAAFTFLAQGAIPAFWADSQLSIGGRQIPLPIGDGESGFLASPAAGRLLAVRSLKGQTDLFDDSGQPIGQSICNCTVNGLQSIGRQSTVRLDTGANGPLWFVAADSGTRVFFVPATR